MQNQLLPPETAVSSAITVTSEEMTTEKETTTQHSAAVTELLVQTKQKIKRRKKRFWTTIAIMEGLLLPFFITLPYIGHAYYLSIIYFVAGLMMVTALVIMVCNLYRKLEFAPDELAKASGVHAIGPLIDAINSGLTPAIRQPIYAALTTLLPQLKASDATLLTPAHRRFLYQMLQWNSNIALTERFPDGFLVAILKALEQVGDEKAVPIVTRLAAQKPRNEAQRRLQAAAQECLPMLIANKEGVGSRQTLLRAALPESAAPDTLLRAAASGTSTAPDELLRPAPHEEVTSS